MTEGNNKLLEKVLELVGVMGELREQLRGYINTCDEKSCETEKSITELKARMLEIETKGSNIVRELLNTESDRIESQSKCIDNLTKDVFSIRKDLLDLKLDVTKKNWRDGVIISFVSIIVTLLITYILDHVLASFMH